MTYQKAYQAFQQKNYDLCLRTLNEIRNNDIEKLDLIAQVHFQKREFQQAYDIYRNLIDKGGEFTPERKENLLTLKVCAQLQQPGVLKTESTDPIPGADEIIEQVQLINLNDASIRDVSSKQDSSKKKRKNKKRKKRLPKQYDPVAGPDPERWLPRRDRKGNAHKQKKRRQRPRRR